MDVIFIRPFSPLKCPDPPPPPLAGNYLPVFGTATPAGEVRQIGLGPQPWDRKPSILCKPFALPIVLTMPL